jgi:hypothetical protein
MQVLTKLHYPKVNNFVLASFLTDCAKVKKPLCEVPDEPRGIPAENTAGYYKRGGLPYQLLAGGAVHTMGPSQGKNL